MNKVCSALLMLALSGSIAKAQYQFEHLNHLNSIKQAKGLYKKEVNAHTSIQPLNTKELDTLIAGDASNPVKQTGWLTRKAFYEDLVALNTKDFALTLNPVVNLQLGHELEQSPYRYVNTRGFLVEGRIGKNVTFYSSFLENQARFANYVNTHSQYRGVVLGQGTNARPFPASDSSGFDYAFVAAEVSYNPNKFFTFTAGQGRNFFGEGYRSMLLSDVAYSYPFFRVETSFWRIKYVNLWAQLYDIRPNAIAPRPQSINGKKFLSSHYLSININSRLNVSFFEAIVSGDSLQEQGLDVSFLNPVIFYRPVEYQLGSRQGNALLGMAPSYKISNGLMAYGQFILDEFSLEDIRAGNGSWVNKFGWQLGLKNYKTFGVKGLFTRLEYNAARPYTYSHRVVLTNYGHFSSPLAHPWGANFQEFLAQVIYQRKRWELELQFNYGVLGLDTAGGQNFGTDIYLSYNGRAQDEGNSIGQGITGNLIFTQLRAAWVANPATNLKLEAGLRYRNLTASESNITTRPFTLDESLWFFAGLRTELFNRYYDF
jgi:hypothetical protein